MSGGQSTSSGSRRGNGLKYRRGTLVHVKTRNEGVLEGYVLENPEETEHPTSLSLYRVRKITIKKRSGEVQAAGGIRRAVLLNRLDIVKVTVITENALADWQLDRLAVYCNYREIDNGEDFTELMSELTEQTTDLVEPIDLGLNLYGKNIGRNGIVDLVCLYRNGGITALKVKDIVRVHPSFWRDLEVAIFSNENITKVVYNASKIADFLNMRVGLSFNNVYDVRMAEVAHCCATLEPEALDSGSLTFQYKPLSTVLETYMDIAVFPRELELLKWFEKQNFTLFSPLTAIMEDSDYKDALEIEMRYLLSVKHVLISQAPTLSPEMAQQMMSQEEILVPIVEVRFSHDDEELPTATRITKENMDPNQATQDAATAPGPEAPDPSATESQASRRARRNKRNVVVRMPDFGKLSLQGKK